MVKTYFIKNIHKLSNMPTTQIVMSPPPPPPPDEIPRYGPVMSLRGHYIFLHTETGMVIYDGVDIL